MLIQLEITELTSICIFFNLSISCCDLGHELVGTPGLRHAFQILMSEALSRADILAPVPVCEYMCCTPRTFALISLSRPQVLIYTQLLIVYYRIGAAAVQWIYTERVLPIHFSGFNCTGTEETVWDCPRNETVGYSCNHYQQAAVVCQEGKRCFFMKLPPVSSYSIPCI